MLSSPAQMVDGTFKRVPPAASERFWADHMAPSPVVLDDGVIPRSRLVVVRLVSVVRTTRVAGTEDRDVW